MAKVTITIEDNAPGKDGKIKLVHTEITFDPVITREQIEDDEDDLTLAQNAGCHAGIAIETFLRSVPNGRVTTGADGQQADVCRIDLGGQQ